MPEVLRGVNLSHVDLHPLPCHGPHMSTLTVELPTNADLHDGDEVTIHARVIGTRLVADTVQSHPIPAAADAQQRADAIDEFLRLWSSDAQREWTDEEITKARHQHILRKHLK